MHVGNVDVGAAVVVQIAESGVHAFVGVAADGAGKAAFNGQEAFSLFVDVQFVGAEIVGDVKVGKAVVVQVARSDRHRPAFAAKAVFAVGDLREAAAAQVAQQQVFVGIVCVVPTAVHDVEHPPVAPVFGLRQFEDVVGNGAVVAGQITLHDVADDDVEAAVVVVIQNIGGNADLIVVHGVAAADFGKAERAGFLQIVTQQAASAEAHAEQQVLVAVVVHVEPGGRGNQAVGFGMFAVVVQLRQREAFETEVPFVQEQLGAVLFAFERLGQENVGQAVVVRIGDGGGITHRQQPFGHMLHTRVGTLPDVAFRTADAALRSRNFAEAESYSVRTEGMGEAVCAPTGAANQAGQQQGFGKLLQRRQRIAVLAAVLPEQPQAAQRHIGEGGIEKGGETLKFMQQQINENDEKRHKHLPFP